MAYAEGTHKNYRTQWRAYLYFCFYFGFTPLPASLEAVCLYCQFLSCSMTTQLVRTYLSGVKYLHVSIGFDFPFYEAPQELKLTLRGLDCMVKHAPLRAPPVTPSLLRALVQCSSRASVQESVFSWYFFLLFFFSPVFRILFRRPNLLTRPSIYAGVTLFWLASVFLSPSSGPKPISPEPSLSLFHDIVFQIHCCVRFELIFKCAHVYRARCSAFLLHCVTFRFLHRCYKSTVCFCLQGPPRTYRCS